MPRKLQVGTPTELEEHLAFMNYIMKAQPDVAEIIFHVANERKTSFRTGKLLKRMGVRPGVSDFILLWPVQPYHGLCIELKRTKDFDVKESQVRFLKRSRHQGYAAELAFGCEDAIRVLTTYLAGTLIQGNLDIYDSKMIR